jgi:Uma2 family endonuclease
MNAMLPLAELKPHKLTVEDYLTLHRQGRFDQCGKIELLDGEIYEMSPQLRPHVIAKNELGWRIRSELNSLGLSLRSYIEPTISVEPGSAPEPDIIICKPPLEADARKPDFFPVETVMLAVEVSLTTLVTDLEYKRRLYAHAQIAEYWVLDISASCVHQFWEPTSGDYAQKRIVPVGERLSCITIPGLSVATDGLY